MSLALSLPGYADDLPVYRGEEVVVTASRVPEKASQALSPVTVITPEEIAQSGQQTLAELLQARGGVEVASAGGFGQPESVFIRGANSNHTLVLVDGIRISSATAGTTALENIPLNQIERIEIVPGPLSSLYGSDAIGGVVQIFTKAGHYSGPSASVGAGAYDTWTASGGIGTRFNDTSLSFNLGYFDTGGFDATKPSIPFGQHNPDRDGYRNANFSGRLAHRFGADHEAGLTFFQSEGSTHFDSGPASDDVNRQTLSAFSFYSRNRITSMWQSLVRLGEGRDHSTITGAFPGFFNTDQPQLTWQNDFKLGVGVLTAGLEYLKQKVTSDTAYAQTRRTIRSAFAGYQGTHGRHGWQINIRNDDNSQFGSHTTGSVGYGFELGYGLRVRAAAGTAFHAPTFNDLYFPGFSNPNLKPERSRSWEAGMDYQAGSGRFSATYFDNRVTDLIALDATFTPQNLNKARIKGTELSYQGEWAGVQLGARLTFQDPVNEDTGTLLPRRARQFGSLNAAKSWGPWSLGAELTASGPRFDRANEAPGTRLAGYGVVNLLARYALAKGWSLTARWDNVFNRDYELVQHYNTPGSNFFVALRYQPAK